MKKKTISDEEMKTVELDSINIQMSNEKTAGCIYSAVISSGGSRVEANACVGYYLRYVVGGLLKGLREVPSIEGIERELECSNLIACMINLAMVQAYEQIKSTRTSRIGGGKTKGNRTNHAILCPDLMESDGLAETLEGADIEW